MADQINDVFAFTAINQKISATSTALTAAIDVSGFELGFSVAWNVVGLTGSSISNIDILESDTAAGVFQAIPESRFIFSELFVKEFGSNSILELQGPTGPFTLVSYFGVRDTKKFIRVQVAVTVTSAGTTDILVNLFLRTESSPVRINQVGFSVVEP